MIRHTLFLWMRSRSNSKHSKETKSMLLLPCLLLLILVLTACESDKLSDSAAAPEVATPLPPQQQPTQPAPNPLFISPVTVPSATVPSATEPQRTVQKITEWSTFTHVSGVSIEYPTGWTVEQFSWGSSDTVYFTLPTAGDSNGTAEESITLSIYQRPLAERAVTDPYNWRPNEGAVEVQWAQPVAVDNATGLMFVWAPYDAFVPPDPFSPYTPLLPSILAIYYSALHELDVRVESNLKEETVEIVRKQWFDAAIPQQEPIFLHMVQSVRFPTPSVNLSPLPTPTPFPGTPYPCTTDLPAHLFRTEMSGEWMMCRGVLGNRYTLLYPWDLAVEVIDGPAGQEWRFVDTKPPTAMTVEVVDGQVYYTPTNPPIPETPIAIHVRIFATDLPLDAADQMVYPDGTPVVDPNEERSSGSYLSDERGAAANKPVFKYRAFIGETNISRVFVRFPAVDERETVLFLPSPGWYSEIIGYGLQRMYSTIEPLLTQP